MADSDSPVARWSARYGALLGRALVAWTVTALAAGGVAWFSGFRGAADVCWIAGTAVALIPAVYWTVSTLLHGRAGVDLIAVLSLAGTLLVGEYLAGALIAVMLSGGRALDAAAQRRATRDLRALLERAPHTARRRIGDEVRTIPLEEAEPGDILVVASGEVVPVDGRVRDITVALDESALTGEPLQVERGPGEPVRSGVVNVGVPFELSATATAADSTYAGIVALARQAGAETAPVIRLADRYAAWFLPLTLLVAGAAYAVSRSAERAVAVLVVATPCPLLLAAPVAIVSGLSRASRLGVVVRSGGALESLGHATTLAMDKTGTLTTGRPRVATVVAAPGSDDTELLRLAASVDQLSPHVLAEAIVTAALDRGCTLSMPVDVVEAAGTGVTGTVDGIRVQVGSLPEERLRAPWARTVLNRADLDAAAIAWITVDDVVAGAIVLRDPLRRHAPRTLRRLREAGLSRLVMLTGDRSQPAREIATVLGIDQVYAGLTPAGKVDAVRQEGEGAVTVMVGDGINDAPALAAATVGVAMGARGSTASSEAADIVLTTDRLDRLADAMDIARWSRRIAVRSAVAGMAMSLAAMAVAAVGWLPPAPGALLQEAIDVSVILYALRALGTDPATRTELPPTTAQLLHRFADEHETLRDTLDLLRGAADQLAAGADAAALTKVTAAHRFLVDDLLPHEQAEETQLYPALATPLGSREATATMSRTHAEIQRLTQRIGSHVELARGAGRVDPEQRDDLLSSLYGLDELLRLHFAQEEENYFTLVDDPAGAGRASRHTPESDPAPGRPGSAPHEGTTL
ncbi:heavy metal translocating P-type ATPase [Nocardia stercoris]|uniref:Heavy metal translocating P-type ATPase n=1 Tax=Nocardia stercoris TaxID=2483361 RepID=A0A3M2L846_9NOCA|nr:heavy metal translocating P-type ATPase [Nocardia stercoris]RMI33554.1 heavy metal translocating P-type ATPase [Nocardia stercoris]